MARAETFPDRISHRLQLRQCRTSARVQHDIMDVGSVDRVCVGVGGPIDFLAHVKAAREESPFSPPTTHNLRQSPSTSRDGSPLLCRLHRAHRRRRRHRRPSSLLVFDFAYATRTSRIIVEPAFFDTHRRLSRRSSLCRTYESRKGERKLLEGEGGREEERKRERESFDGSP